MKLGLIGPVPPPNGGMAMQTQQLQRLLGEEGVDVELLPTNPPYQPQWVAKLKGLRALFRILPYLLSVWRLAGRVDVVHLMANSGWSWQLFCAPVIWLCSFRKTPVIVNYRGGNAGDYLAQSSRRILPSLRRATALVVPSGFLQAVFSRYGIKSNIVPNIVDRSLFYPGSYTRLESCRLSGEGDSNQAKQKTVFLVITRNLEEIYGLDIAVRALAMLHEQGLQAQLTIAGSGPCLTNLQQLADELGVRSYIDFAGRLDRTGVVALYQQADVMLNPARVDNMPNSLLEAMACGLPIVSTRVGGVPYIIEDGRNGLLVPIDGWQQMAQAVLKLVNDPTLADALADAGLQQCQSYEWPLVREQWFELYRRYGSVQQ
ncbi:MAG: glycosyltransferase family 4 protein [Parahaliea sp.]